LSDFSEAISTGSCSKESLFAVNKSLMAPDPFSAWISSLGFTASDLDLANKSLNSAETSANPVISNPNFIVFCVDRLL